MTENILNWNEIQETYKDSTILIGNGASIAISDKFHYKNIFKLIKKIKNSDARTKIENLFNKFKSRDFELILRKLSHAEDINEILKIKDNGEIIKYKRGIKGVLIQAIIEIHPPHSDVEKKLKSFYKFIRDFTRIISLNYDLLIYWAVMKQKYCEIKDGFSISDSLSGTLKLRPDSLQYLNNNTLVCYLHGNIALAYDQNKTTVKIIKKENNLLDTIKAFCKKNTTYTPLFVSEGTAEQKKQAIKRSPYLSTIFDEVLQNLPNNCLTIYGFNFSEQDLYILDKIAKNKNKIVKVAISVHKDENEADYFSKVKKKLKKHLNITDNNIEFFDSATVGYWSKKTVKKSNATHQQPAPTSQECDIFQ